jgi:hypothetical protein
VRLAGRQPRRLRYRRNRGVGDPAPAPAVAEAGERCYTWVMDALLPALGQWREFAELAQNLRRDGFHGYVEGCASAAKACVIAGLAARLERPLLVITHTNEQAEQLYDDIVSFTGSAPDEHACFLPSLEILLYEEFSPDFDIIRDRLNWWSSPLPPRSCTRLSHRQFCRARIWSCAKATSST